jgi:hypothetical protein
MNPTTASESTTGVKKTTLVEARPANIAVEQVRHRDAQRRRADEQEEQEDRVVDDGLEEIPLEDREDLDVVLESHPGEIAEAGSRSSR